eukprot:1851242-Amphidinium_carterae.1
MVGPVGEELLSVPAVVIPEVVEQFSQLRLGTLEILLFCLAAAVVVKVDLVVYNAILVALCLVVV